MNQDEYIVAATKAVNEFWQSPHRPANLLNTEHNANVLAEAMWNFSRSSGYVPSVRELKILVQHLGDMDSGGKLQYHHSAPVPPPPPVPTPIDEIPFPEEKSLAWMRAREDLAEAPKDKIKEFLQPAALSEYNHLGQKITSLNAKFNARADWLKRNNVRRPKSAEQERTTVELSPVEKERAKQKAEIEAICKDIMERTKGYTAFAQRQRVRLTTRLNELLNDPNVAYVRTERGGKELVTGFEAVKLHMRDELRDSDNPIR